MANSAYVVYGEGGIQPAQCPEEARTMAVRLPGGVSYPAGQVLGERTAATQQNETQTVTISGSPTGGTFVLQFFGATTAAIAYNAAASAVQSALEALATIGSGNVAVSGSAGGPYTVTFQGDLANRDVPLMTTIASLTGGSSPSVAVAIGQEGNPGARYFAAYDDGASDGSQTAKAILKYATDTQPDGTVNNSQGGGGRSDVTVYIAGTFNCGDLTGLDANGVADLGRLIVGTAYNSTGAILRIG